jgi:hypothetical protein
MEVQIAIVSLGWDEPDRKKVRHMIKRGFTDEQIHQYMGMPLEMIAKVRSGLEAHMRRKTVFRPVCGEEPSRLGDEMTRHNMIARKRDKRYLKAVRQYMASLETENQ